MSVFRKWESGWRGLDSAPGAWGSGGTGKPEARGTGAEVRKGSVGASLSHRPEAASGLSEQEPGPRRKKVAQSHLSRWHGARTGLSCSVRRPQVHAVTSGMKTIRPREPDSCQARYSAEVAPDEEDQDTLRALWSEQGVSRRSPGLWSQALWVCWDTGS